MIFVQIFRPPSDIKNNVSKMPQKQEKMSFKNVWKKNDKIKKNRPPLMTPRKIFAPPFRVDGFRPPQSPHPLFPVPHPGINESSLRHFVFLVMGVKSQRRAF